MYTYPLEGFVASNCKLGARKHSKDKILPKYMVFGEEYCVLILSIYMWCTVQRVIKSFLQILYTIIILKIFFKK